MQFCVNCKQQIFPFSPHKIIKIVNFLDLLSCFNVLFHPEKRQQNCSTCRYFVFTSRPNSLMLKISKLKRRRRKILALKTISHGGFCGKLRADSFMLLGNSDETTESDVKRFSFREQTFHHEKCRLFTLTTRRRFMISNRNSLINLLLFSLTTSLSLSLTHSHTHRRQF